ncbi:hypothetical protein [Vibrio sp. EA2]|uniref:hypothetical protein n=1 Tax=Vibrio sp. EA2 TaxID=3079860 RepID=UPI00294999A4|nr:hypothetical protein [Vibrio sp. EA2]MDV6251079.1 hypothetical protein [Vibrio sp. EA2]
MKISTSKDFRKAVVRIEKLMRENQYLGLVNLAASIEKENPRHAGYLDIQINRVINHRSGLLPFKWALETNLQSVKLRSKLRAYHQRIRKQDEAPQVGADSSSLEA